MLDYVVQVDKNEVVQKDVIYQGLKNSRSVCETKRHHQVLIVAQRSIKGCFPLVTLRDSHQALRRSNFVKMVDRERDSNMESIRGSRYLFFYGYGVEPQ